VAAAIYDKARKGTAAAPAEHERFASWLMLLFGRLDAEKGWTKQLHLGARRNVNTRMMRTLGREGGLFFAVGRRGLVGQYLDRWFGITLPFTTAATRSTTTRGFFPRRAAGARTRRSRLHAR